MANLTKEERAKKEQREARVPFGVHRSKLTATNIPNGYVGRIVNDTPGRVQAALAGGYQFVDGQGVFLGEEAYNGNTDLGSAVSMVVDRNAGGQPVRGYLMCIKQELYDADQEAKLEKVREIENQIKTGQVSRATGDGRYIPKSGIHVETKVGDYKP